MARYQIWDKKSNLYTPSGARFAAQDYINRYALWAENPNVKVVITTGAINCGVFMEFESMRDQYKRMGAEITNDMTDAEVLAAIEAFEDRPQETVVSAEERIAAALEYQAIASMPDEEETV